jgi:hypothetical protein
MSVMAAQGAYSPFSVGEFQTGSYNLEAWKVGPLWAQTGHKLNFFFLFAVLGFELRAFTLSHSTSHFLCWAFSR